jgi:hypothetical protein
LLVHVGGNEVTVTPVLRMRRLRSAIVNPAFDELLGELLRCLSFMARSRSPRHRVHRRLLRNAPPARLNLGAGL